MLDKAIPPQVLNDSASSSYVNVTPIVAGTFTLPERAFVSPVDSEARRTVPSLSFLIDHPKRGLNKGCLIFDLGLRSRAEAYISELQPHLKARQPIHFRDAKEILERNNVDATQIGAVILSHVHWDHHGEPSDFPAATFIVGHGSMGVLEDGLPGRGSHSHFDAHLFKGVSAVELSVPTTEALALSNPRLSAMFGRQDLQWEPFGLFGQAIDLYKDGSAFLVPASGHLPGHINLLCRIAPKRWMYLAGDSFHDERLLSGEKHIATWDDNGQVFCIHYDRVEAQRTIDRINELKILCATEGIEVDVIAAHDVGWMRSNEERCLV